MKDYQIEFEKYLRETKGASNNTLESYMRDMGQFIKYLLMIGVKSITEVNRDIVDGYVLIYCKGAGIAPSSQYYGFYYSEDNLPVGVFDGQIVCSNSELVEYENGYRYLDSGYNEFYTEHIKGNIYFYSAAF